MLQVQDYGALGVRKGAIQLPPFHPLVEADEPPLGADLDRISQIMCKRLYGRVEPTESRVHWMGRRGVQVFALASGIPAQVGFMNVYFKFADGNRVLGAILGGASMLSYGSLFAFCSLKIIESELAPQFPEEVDLLQQRRSCLSNTILKISIFGAGLAAKVPPAAVVYIYNDRNWIYSLAALLSESSYSIYSLNLSMKAFLAGRNLSPVEKNLVKMKGKLLELFKEVLEESDEQRWGTFIGAIRETDDLVPLDQIKTVIRSLFQMGAKEPLQMEGTADKVKRAATILTGFTLSAAQLGFLGVLTYQGMQLFSSDNALNLFGAISCTACTCYLTTKMIVEGTFKGVRTVVNLAQKKRPPSLAARHASILHKTLHILFISSCILSLTGSVQLAGDAFDGPIRPVMQTATAIGGVIISTVGCLQLLNGFLRFKLQIRGQEHIQQIMLLSQQLQIFMNLIENSPLLDFAQFSKILPARERQQWLQELNMASDEIDHYIQLKRENL